MSQQPYLNQSARDEHRKENNAKAVDLYAWNSDILEWVRVAVQEDGKIKTVNSTGALTFQSNDQVITSTYTISKVINDIVRTKTYGFNQSDELISISDWE